MKLPNIISLSRVIVLLLIMLLINLPHKGIASLVFLLFLAGAFSDWLDGFLARKLKTVTNFGKVIDALTDKIFILGLFIILLGVDILFPGSFILVVLTLIREFLITGLRLVASSKGVVLAAEKTGKLKTAAQLVALSAYFLNNALEMDFSFMIVHFSFILEVIELLAFLAFLLSTFLTLFSGLRYMIKYWKIFTAEA